MIDLESRKICAFTFGIPSEPNPRQNKVQRLEIMAFTTARKYHQHNEHIIHLPGWFFLYVFEPLDPLWKMQSREGNTSLYLVTARHKFKNNEIGNNSMSKFA